MRVLVVDDAESNRVLLKAVLTKEGMEVVGEALSGEDALAVFRSCNPDVVLMDLVMPHLNGCDAARRILRNNPRAKIVAMSGLSNESVQNDAHDAGMVAFVAKPIDPPRLVSVLQRAVNA